MYPIPFPCEACAWILNFEIDEGGWEKHERGKNEGLLRETWKVFDQYIFMLFLWSNVCKLPINHEKIIFHFLLCGTQFRWLSCLVRNIMLLLKHDGRDLGNWEPQLFTNLYRCWHWVWSRFLICCLVTSSKLNYGWYFFWLVWLIFWSCSLIFIFHIVWFSYFIL